METAFILKGVHLPSNNVARYLTLDKDIEMIIFLKKAEWPNRIKEECFRCERCRCYIKPKEAKFQKDSFFYHKATCNPKIIPPEKEVSNGSILI
jgi:hypothetical protein